MNRYLYRVRFEKRGPVRFVSHRDVIRIFMRAVRMAGLPMVFTEGYHPRPRMAFAPPLKTGLESRAEYVDLQLGRTVPDLEERLNRSLPGGIRVVAALEVPYGTRPLAATVSAAEYRVPLDRWWEDGWVPPGLTSPAALGAHLDRRCREILEEDPTVRRKTKKGIKTIHVLRGIHELCLTNGGEEPGPCLRMVLALGGSGHVQTNEVLESLLQAPPEKIPTIPVVRWELMTSDSEEGAPLSAYLFER
jgi:radical SAM-linked protein